MVIFYRCHFSFSNEITEYDFQKMNFLFQAVLEKNEAGILCPSCEVRKCQSLRSVSSSVSASKNSLWPSVQPKPAGTRADRTQLVRPELGSSWISDPWNFIPSLESDLKAKVWVTSCSMNYGRPEAIRNWTVYNFLTFVSSILLSISNLHVYLRLTFSLLLWTSKYGLVAASNGSLFNRTTSWR